MARAARPDERLSRRLAAGERQPDDPLCCGQPALPRARGRRVVRPKWEQVRAEGRREGVRRAVRVCWWEAGGADNDAGAAVRYARGIKFILHSPALFYIVINKEWHQNVK